MFLICVSFACTGLAIWLSEQIVFFQPQRMCFINSFSNSSHSVNDSARKCSDSGEGSHTKHLPDHRNFSCLGLRPISVTREFGDENTVCSELAEILQVPRGQGSGLSPIRLKNCLTVYFSDLFISLSPWLRLLDSLIIYRLQG